MPSTTFDSLRADIASEPSDVDAEYMAKQVHHIPSFPVVDRTAVILTMARDEVVVDIGGSGRLHEAIKKVAKRVYTIDKHVDLTDQDAFEVDLDEWVASPSVSGAIRAREAPTLVVCGEVLEHLANPGNFLRSLKIQFDVPKIFTTPNALSEAGLTWARRGIENVNIDHVAYYSWRTLRTLFDRYEYDVVSWAWYHGAPCTAEGLVVVTR